VGFERALGAKASRLRARYQGFEITRSRVNGKAIELCGAAMPYRAIYTIRSTLSRFAERLSVTRMHSSDIEHGRRTVSLGRAGKFATVLGPSQEQFVRLGLQDQVRDAGLNLRVEVHAA
jgi:plasmid maintenance system antidote protein VapI